MKKRNSKLYLKDILEAIEKINNYTKNLSFEEFSQNTMVVDAVIRNFEMLRCFFRFKSCAGAR